MLGEVRRKLVRAGIYIYTVGGSGLHEVGKWRVSGGEENKGEEGRDESYR